MGAAVPSDYTETKSIRSPFKSDRLILRWAGRKNKTDIKSVYGKFTPSFSTLSLLSFGNNIMFFFFCWEETNTQYHPGRCSWASENPHPASEWAPSRWCRHLLPPTGAITRTYKQSDIVMFQSWFSVEIKTESLLLVSCYGLGFYGASAGATPARLKGIVLRMR